VAAGRALVRKPEIFLLDEPLSNLDAKLRQHLRAELSRIHNELNITMIYVTHDQSEAMTLGNRIAVINEGRIQQIDSPEKKYSDQANLFVAKFIGFPEINLFDVKNKENNIELFGERIAIDKKMPQSRAVAAVRPEDIEVSAEGRFEALLEIKEVDDTGRKNTLRIDFKAEKLLFFNKETGEKI